MTEPTNSKQCRTLQRVFARPTPNNILWADIVSLLKHLGCTMRHRGGSMVIFEWGGVVPYFEHIPHPSRQTPAETVERTRKFIERIGGTP